MIHRIASGYCKLPCSPQKSPKAASERHIVPCRLIPHRACVTISLSRKEAMTNYRLDGHVAIITGSSKGLGKQMAEALADAGAVVALVARNAELLEGVRAGIADRGGRAWPFVADVSEEAEIGRLSVLIHKTVGVP